MEKAKFGPTQERNLSLKWRRPTTHQDRPNLDTEELDHTLTHPA